VQKGFNPESGWIKRPHLVSTGAGIGKAKSGVRSSICKSGFPEFLGSKFKVRACRSPTLNHLPRAHRYPAPTASPGLATSIRCYLLAMSIALTTYWQQFVDQLISSGRYNNQSEVIRAGLRALEEREKCGNSSKSSPVDGRVSRMTRPCNGLWRGKSRSARDADDRSCL